VLDICSVFGLLFGSFVKVKSQNGFSFHSSFPMVIDIHTHLSTLEQSIVEPFLSEHS